MLGKEKQKDRSHFYKLNALKPNKRENQLIRNCSIHKHFFRHLTLFIFKKSKIYS